MYASRTGAFTGSVGLLLSAECRR